MTRRVFGQTSADWAFTVGDGNVPVLSSAVGVAMWTAQSSGAPVTDLLDNGGSPVTVITSGDGGTYPVGTIPEFQGPDDGTSVLWADGGAGIRFKLVATDLGDALDGKLGLSGGTMAGELRLQDDSPAASQDYVAAHAGGSGAPSIEVFGYTGILSVVTGTARVYNDTGRALTIGTVRASAGVGPVGQNLIVDVNLSGTSIYATTPANRPKINDGAVTGTAGAPDTATWAIGSYLTVDVDQVGTTTPGSGLTVTIPAT